ncbi:Uncharacterised protein [Chromobacterium violaceum]|uniref:Uncharacterized protein n=1 Tax=Chromobacterium violaceum TaxID=536 RepID=A0A447TFK3_CHRVL|nr:Uncharacterised protein [Chromobacterium violaceum]
MLAPHRGITRLVCGNRYAAFQADDRIAWAANPAFDASTLEIWARWRMAPAWWRSIRTRC